MPATIKEVLAASERFQKAQEVLDSEQRARDVKKAARDAAVTALQESQARVDQALAEQLAARQNLANVINS